MAAIFSTIKWEIKSLTTTTMTKQTCDFCEKEIINAYVNINYTSREPHRFQRKDICGKCQKDGLNFLKEVFKEMEYVSK
jgi:hypothetical protein